jgi:hypothetical protein
MEELILRLVKDYLKHNARDRSDLMRKCISFTFSSFEIINKFICIITRTRWIEKARNESKSLKKLGTYSKRKTHGKFVLLLVMRLKIHKFHLLSFTELLSIVMSGLLRQVTVKKSKMHFFLLIYHNIFLK